MRLSVNEFDPGFAAYKKIGDKRIRVFLDDAEVRFPVTADEEAEFVVKARQCSNGDIMLSGDNIIYETLRGKVRIVIEEWPHRTSHPWDRP